MRTVRFSTPFAFRKLRFAWLLLGLVGGVPFLSAERSTADEPLTAAAQVRSLSAKEAGRPLPVHLRAIYMGEADPYSIAFVVQDETDGIYVQAATHFLEGLSRGDVLEIDGVTNPGGYAPFIAATDVRVVGHGEVPDPIRLPLDDLNNGQMDAKWVEITGVVRSAESKTADEFAQAQTAARYVPSIKGEQLSESPKTKIKLAAGSARLMTEVFGTLDPAKYVDAEVRLRGLCFNLHNSNRQFVRPFIQSPRGVEVEILSPPGEDSFDGEPRRVSSLLQFEQSSGRHGHRVHIRGVVIRHKPGVGLWVRDGDHSLMVETKLVDELEPGDEVDVLGFPVLGEYSPVLEDAVFRKRGRNRAPIPVTLQDVSDVLRNDANLVQLKARLVETRTFPDSVELTFDWLGANVRGRMLLSDTVKPPSNWLPGSVVEVSGVCSVAKGEPVPLGGLWMAHSFQLFLRTPADMVIVRPAPWWTAERIAWTLSGVLVISLATIAAIMLASRRRLKEQENRRAMAETEFSAILNERNRMAREIHDTLSQSLGAISLQLELARTHASELGAAVRDHLGAAHKLARSALADARQSIWNMRSQSLEKQDLGDALGQVLKQLVTGAGVEAEMKVEGARRRLSPMIENNLLRIGQEAITNACKHAKANRIDVALSYDNRSVRLSVKDDGVGIVDGAKPNPERRSFGLVGIRERAELLGGTVDIDSAPGKGTRIVVSIAV